jgi:ankyrin repeat protein
MFPGLGVAKLLLNHGAHVNAKGGHQRTPLHLASSKGDLDLSRLLIEYGADVDAQDDEQSTPFSIALANGHRTLARLLLKDKDEVGYSTHVKISRVRPLLGPVQYK